MWNARPTRRRVLTMLGVGSVGIPLLAACSTPAPSPSPTVAAPAAAPTSAPVATATVAAAAKPTTPPAAAASTSAPTASGAATVVTAPAQGKVVVGGVKLPTYVPYAGARPDAPGSPDGMIDAGYKAYPAHRPKSVQTTPGDGSDINIMTYTTGADPDGAGQQPRLAGGQPPGRRQSQGQHDAVRRLFRHQTPGDHRRRRAAGPVLHHRRPGHHPGPGVLQRQGRRPHPPPQRRRRQGLPESRGDSDARLEDRPSSTPRSTAFRSRCGRISGGTGSTRSCWTRPV